MDTKCFQGQVRPTRSGVDTLGLGKNSETLREGVETQSEHFAFHHALKA